MRRHREDRERGWNIDSFIPTTPHNHKRTLMTACNLDWKAEGGARRTERKRRWLSYPLSLLPAMVLALAGCGAGTVPPVVAKLDAAVAHLQGLPELYGAMLETCAHDEACEAKVQASWLPVIEGMEQIHQVFCAAHDQADPGCGQ